MRKINEIYKFRQITKNPYSLAAKEFPFASDIQLNFNALEADGYTLYEDISGGVDNAEVQGGERAYYDQSSKTTYDSNYFQPNTGDFTLEFTMDFDATLVTQINNFSPFGKGLSTSGLYVYTYSSGEFGVLAKGDGVNPDLQLSDYVFSSVIGEFKIKIQRISGVGYLYINDVLETTTPAFVNDLDNASLISIGDRGDAAQKFKGWIYDVKLTVGSTVTLDAYQNDSAVNSIDGAVGTWNGTEQYALFSDITPQSTIDAQKNGYFQYPTGEQVVNPQFALPVGATAIPPANIHNLINSYININPTASADPKYDVWDRRNQTTASRDSIYYDSNNPWSYYVGKDYNELDISVLDSYMNQADKEKAYAKVTTDYCDYDQIAQVFSYATQKTNSVALNIHKYIGNECQLVTNNGQQVYNNGLPVWVDL